MIRMHCLLRTIHITLVQKAEDALKQREVILASKLVNFDSKRAEYNQVINKLDATRYSRVSYYLFFMSPCGIKIEV